jgi:hypothetical protein
MQNIGNINFKCVSWFSLNFCIMVDETVNFERLNIMLLQEHTISFSLQLLHSFVWAVLIQATDLSNFPPSNNLEGQAWCFYSYIANDLRVLEWSAVSISLTFRRSLLSPSSRSNQSTSQNTENLLNIKEAEVVIGVQCLEKITEENVFTSYKIWTWDIPEFKIFIGIFNSFYKIRERTYWPSRLH